jgi:hypothetical protein
MCQPRKSQGPEPALILFPNDDVLCTNAFHLQVQQTFVAGQLPPTAPSTSSFTFTSHARKSLSFIFIFVSPSCFWSYSSWPLRLAVQRLAVRSPAWIGVQIGSDLSSHVSTGWLLATPLRTVTQHTRTSPLPNSLTLSPRPGTL